MDRNHPNFAKPGESGVASGRGSRLGQQWAAVHDAAEAVGILAGIEPEKPGQKIRNFAVLILDVDGWRLELAKNHIADMTAMMQPGLTALLATHARGHNASAAAVTLWNEFCASRDAVLALIPETGKMGPRRSA